MSTDRSHTNPNQRMQDHKQGVEVNVDAVCPAIEWKKTPPTYGTLLVVKNQVFRAWIPCIATAPSYPATKLAHTERARAIYQDAVVLRYGDGASDNADFESAAHNVNENIRRFPEQPWPVGTFGLVNICGARTLAAGRWIRCRLVAHADPHQWLLASSASKLIVELMDLPRTLAATNLELNQGRIEVDRFAFAPFCNQAQEPTLHMLGVRSPSRVMVRTELNPAAQNGDGKGATAQEEVAYALPRFLAELHDDMTAMVWLPERGIVRVPTRSITPLPFNAGDIVWFGVGEKDVYKLFEVIEQQIHTTANSGWSYTARDITTGEIYGLSHSEMFGADTLIHHMRVQHPKLGQCRIHNPYGRSVHVDFVLESGSKPLRDAKDATADNKRVQLVPVSDAWGAEIKSELLIEVQPDKHWLKHLRAQNSHLDPQHPDYILDRDHPDHPKVKAKAEQKGKAAGDATAHDSESSSDEQ